MKTKNVSTIDISTRLKFVETKSVKLHRTYEFNTLIALSLFMLHFYQPVAYITLREMFFKFKEFKS